MADGRSSPHGAHDLELVAAFAAGDAAADRAARAADLVASCESCRLLADDVRALRLATRALPAPSRTRDFRLSAETAARLRPASPWERFRRSLVAPGGLGRPLTASLMTLGLAGLLVSAVPFLPAGLSTLTQRDATTGSLAAPESNVAAGGAAPQAATVGATDADAVTAGSGAKAAPGASPVPAGGPAAVALPPDAAVASAGPGRGSDLAPVPSPGTGVSANQGAAGASSDRVASGTPSPPPSDEPGPALPLPAFSVVALLAGFGLFLARRSAARA